MIYCPYCGTPVEKDESYCMKCGKQLPDHFADRFTKKTHKLWLLPAAISLVMMIAIGASYFILQHKTHMAEQLYEQGEHAIKKEDYQRGKELFKEAKDYHPSFPQAAIARAFTDKAVKVQDDIKASEKASQNNRFQTALTLINKTEQQLNQFSGEAVGNMIDTISQQRDAIKTAQLEHDLQQEPTIDELKMLLWDVESIDNEKAAQMTENIRKRIINYTLTKANEQINHHHFKDAKIIVEDGLNYAPKSDKLHSLKTSVENEQKAFEASQEKRIEQAINTAVQEEKINENDAVELVNVSVKDDDQGNLLVKGTVKSVATIPINTVAIKYTLTSADGDMDTTQQVYVFPDTLYPHETGQFEYTHFDLHNKGDDIRVNVNTIKWYTK